MRRLLFAAWIVTVVAISSVHAQGRIVADETECRRCPPIHYDLWLRARAIEPIPLHPSDDPSGWGEQLAVLIEMGNQVWRTIRDLQSTHDWYIGELEPHGREDDLFTWLPDQRLCFVLEDGSLVFSDFLIVTHGEAKRLGPVILLSRGLTATFKDIAVTFPDGRTKCPIYAGFPKGDWDLSNVVGLAMVRREDGPAGAYQDGRTGAACAPEDLSHTAMGPTPHQQFNADSHSQPRTITLPVLSRSTHYRF